MGRYEADHILFGAAYYDEYLMMKGIDRIDEDMAMMKAAGLNVIRIAESTWSTCEPQPGVFDFTYVDRALDAANRAGIDVNTTDHADWQQALQALVDQRPLVKSYVMDEIYNMMESGEAAVAAYYAGDYFTMCDAQADSVDLQFYYPENTNYFIDAMCIPTSCRDQELAECFINFMLSREAAVANAEYIYYASPNRLVYDDPEYIDDMGEDTMAILYPDIGSFRDAYNRSAYRNLDQDTLTYVNSLWETLKIN